MADDGIELPEMVIRGEDLSRLTKQEKKEELLIPKKEEIRLEKESLKDFLSPEVPKRERPYSEKGYHLSFFELSYGSYNTLEYRLVQRRRPDGITTLLDIDGGYSQGFDWKGIFPFGHTSRHHLKGELGLHREEWGVEGGIDYGIKEIYLPYSDISEGVFTGGIRLGGLVSLSAKIDMGAGLEFACGRMRQEDITSTELGYNLEFNTIVLKLPVGIGVRAKHSLIESKSLDIYSLFAESKGIQLDPLRMDIKAGIDNHRDHGQELNLGLLVTWPWRDGNIFLGYKREMESPSFKDLYLENDYVTPNKDLLPLRRGELRLGMDYRYAKDAFLDLTIFIKELKDYPVLEDTSTHLYTPVNIDASIFGLEMELKSYIADHLIQNSSLVFNFVRSYEENKVVPFVPVLKASLSLKYLNERGFEASINPEYIGSQLDGLSKDTCKELPSYFLLNLKLAQHLFNDTLSLFLYGRNILDVEYKERYYYPGWPATFGGGLIWRF